MGDPDRLLAQTSRTFALSIPRLPQPTRDAVTLAYLLFRIADTFEDAADWPRARRLAALDDFAALLREPDPARADALVPSWFEAPAVSAHEGYAALVRETSDVLRRTLALDADTRAVVLAHALRTTEGMARMVARSDDRGSLRLADFEDLRAYCYLVAGIVGELLTDLFVLAAPTLRTAEASEALRARAVAFGEALQLVNILKDSADDARDGRTYLPPAVPRDAVLALARRDLDDAAAYVRTLQEHHAPRGFVEFTALPVILARATLDAVDAHGPGAKVSRDVVLAEVAALDLRLDAHADALDALTD